VPFNGVGEAENVREADNYHTIRYSAFAQMWNEKIAQEEVGALANTDMTLKNAYLLQEYH
jgi:hypothetical protein